MPGAGSGPSLSRGRQRGEQESTVWWIPLDCFRNTAASGYAGAGRRVQLRPSKLAPASLWIRAMNTGERERVERRLAAILAADVAGYSRLMGADEEGTLERLKALRRE